MGLHFVRHRTLPDGRVEQFRPKQENGLFVLADRVVDPQHNKAVNKFYVRDPVAVAARLRRGGVSLRMRGEITGQENLISAREVEIEETPSARKIEDDPFAAFTEWNEPEDEEAFRNL